MKTLFVMFMVMFSVGCTTVEDYEAAVGRTRFTGNVHDQPWDQGLRSVIGKTLYKYTLREIQYPEDNISENVGAMTSDNLQVGLEVAYMWKIRDRECVRNIFLEIGRSDAVASLVHKTYREAVRDVVVELTAGQILSGGRQGVSESVRNLMNSGLDDRCVVVTDFFVRDIMPPPIIQQAIQEKLAREQEVQSQVFQTQVVKEQANQKREEAEGIRDAQAIIAESLTGQEGERYLYWRAMEAMENVGNGVNNLVIVPTENGAPIFFGAPKLGN